MDIERNSRQMPATSTLAKQKDYCDLLYAWLQCHSERENMNSSVRRISKADVKWTQIERDFTRKDDGGKEYKVMARKTIAKYFGFLEEQGLVVDKGDYYYLTVLDKSEANLIEYETLYKMMTVMKRHSLDIYIYLFNRYYANGQEPFIATMKQMKDYIGIASTTTSNNEVVKFTIEFLQRLDLLDYEYIHKDNKTYIQFNWVRNKLPELKK